MRHYKYLACFLALFILPSIQAFGHPKVIVSIRPLHSLVANIMKGVTQPQLLIQAQHSPHTFSLKPSHLQQISQADLVVWVGPELEYFLDNLQKSMQQQVQMMTVPGIQKLTLYATDHQHHHHGHKNTAIDPHIWLNLQNAIALVQAVTQKLVQLDPVNQGQYQNNARILIQRLKQLDQRLQQQLSPYQRVAFLVFHDSLQYFCKHFHLKGLTILTLNPEQPLSIKDFKRAQSNIAKHRIQCIFQEPQLNSPSLQKLAQQFDLKIGTLDPLGVDQVNALDAYHDMMQKLAQNFIDCAQKDKIP